MSKIDRRQFLAVIPSTSLNAKQSAPSTLDCQNDKWGTEPTHYRYINVRDEQGNIVMKTDGSGKPQKTLRLIGEPHCEWADHYVKVRVDTDHFMWYKHWNAAVSLYNFGKLAETEMTWFREEGIKRFRMGMIPLKNCKGSYTAAVTALIKIGALVNVNGNLILREDLEKKDSQRAVEAAAVTNKETVEA